MKLNECFLCAALLFSLVFAGLVAPHAHAQSSQQTDGGYGGAGPGNGVKPLLNVQAAFNGTEPWLDHDHSYYCTYRVYLQAGVKFHIQMESFDFRPCMWIQRSGNNKITPDNAAIFGRFTAFQQARGAAACMWVQVNQTGWYDVVANTEFGSQTGTYSVKVWR